MVDIRKDDVEEVIKLLPKVFQDELKKHDLSKLIEVVFDLGRIPQALFSKGKTIVFGERSYSDMSVADKTSSSSKDGPPCYPVMTFGSNKANLF